MARTAQFDIALQEVAGKEHMDTSHLLQWQSDALEETDGKCILK